MGNGEAILDVVDKLYSGALQGESWDPGLCAMAELLGAVGISFEIFDVKMKAPMVFECSTGTPIPDKLEYMEYYSPRSPRLLADIRSAPGSVTYDHMILSDQEMDRNEFYTDFLAPLDLRCYISVQVLTTPSHQGVFAAQRSISQGHVGEDEIATMKRLAPHLRQAAELRFRLAEARRHAEFGQSGVDLLTEGCIAVSASGTIIRANASAEAMVSLHDGVSIQNNRLVFEDKDGATHLRRCITEIAEASAGAFTGGIRDFPVKRPSGKRPYLISVRPLPPATEFAPSLDRGAALVFIRDADDFGRLDVSLLASCYGLSASETDIAAEIDRGLSVTAIARKREVAVTTIRTQLYAVMAKLGVKRQTDLVRVLARHRLPFV
ncbi:MAG: LuxR C-terminal-related transcriptional regulator [Pseudomonadota bacterium]